MPGGPGPSKLNHIFGKAIHNLGPLVGRVGSQEATFKAVATAAQTVIEKQGLSGVFEATVQVAGTNVIVRGKVVNGIAQIGTFWVP